MIHIGCRYRRPLPPLDDDAKRVQSAMLRRPRQVRRWVRALREVWATVFLLGALALAGLFGKLRG